LCIEEQLVKVRGEDSSKNLGGDKGGGEEEILRYLRLDNEIIKA
jgi:hypothetical protein